MRNINSWIIFSLFALLTITSCQKENIDSVIETEEIITPTTTFVSPNANALLSRTESMDMASDDDGLNFDCINIIFPFNLVDNQGTNYEVTSEESFFNILEGEGDSSIYIVDFVYPINVSINDEEVVEITDNEQLGELFAACIPDGGWNEENFPAYLIDDENSCYKTVYPISLIDAETGETLTVQNEEEFIDVLVEKYTYFAFPINLTDSTEVITVNNVDELFNALFSCNDAYQDSTYWDWEEGFDYIYCFQIEFPLDVITADGTTKTVNNHEELCDLMLQGELLDYAYPLNLINPEGEELIANSSEELDELAEQCGYGEPYEESDFATLIFLSITDYEELPNDSTFTSCYNINYPISGSFQDELGAEQVLTFNTLDEIFDSPFDLLTLVYPVSVTKTTDATEVTLNNSEELYQLVEECYGGN